VRGGYRDAPDAKVSSSPTPASRSSVAGHKRGKVGLLIADW
jgi:hypothetical protein